MNNELLPVTVCLQAVGLLMWLAVWLLGRLTIFSRSADDDQTVGGNLQIFWLVICFAALSVWSVIIWSFCFLFGGHGDL